MHWFSHNQRSATPLGSSPPNIGRNGKGKANSLRDVIKPPPNRPSPRDSSTESSRDHVDAHAKPPTIFEVLDYVKNVFDNESALDTLPIEAAGNAGAWKAWRAYRKNSHQDIDGLASDTGNQSEDEWSWDGVWEDRVRRGVDASVAGSTLFSNASGDDMVGRQQMG